MNTQPFTVDEPEHPIVRESTLSRVAEFAFLAFLLLVFIGLSPFAIRDPAALAAGQASDAGAGDLVREIAYVSVFALIVLAALGTRGIGALRALPVLMALLLAWCIASAAWSLEPDVTLRRAVLASLIVLSAMMSLAAIGAPRALALWRGVLAFVLVVNWLSIPLVAQSVHLPGEVDPGLVGDWRGLYFHKNIAGSVSAITAIVFFFQAWSTKRVVPALLSAAAIGFTVMTRSKSSLALLPVALAAGTIYRVAWRHALDRLIVSVAVAIVFVLVVTAGWIERHAVVQMLSDPTEFTGRAEIWQAEIAFMRDHLFLGAGFGSFADTGALSPLHGYVASQWVDNVAHGHNAYLQLLVTIGSIGFVLALLSLIVFPSLAFWREDGGNLALLSELFALFVFMALHNLLESDFLEGDSPAWVAFLLVLGALRLARSGAPQQQELSCVTA